MANWLVTVEMEHIDAAIGDKVTEAQDLANFYVGDRLGALRLVIDGRKLLVVDEDDFNDWFGK